MTLKDEHGIPLAASAIVGLSGAHFRPQSQKRQAHFLSRFRKGGVGTHHHKHRSEEAYATGLLRRLWAKLSMWSSSVPQGPESFLVVFNLMGSHTKDSSSASGCWFPALAPDGFLAKA
jgi:hypothetical protein